RQLEQIGQTTTQRIYARLLIQLHRGLLLLLRIIGIFFLDLIPLRLQLFHSSHTLVALLGTRIENQISQNPTDDDSQTNAQISIQEAEVRYNNILHKRIAKPAEPAVSRINHTINLIIIIFQGIIRQWSHIHSKGNRSLLRNIGGYKGLVVMIGRSSIRLAGLL